MIRRPPRSTLFPTRRSSDLCGFRSEEVCDSTHASSSSVAARTDAASEAWAAVSIRVPISLDRKSTRLNSSHDQISYAVFCLKKKNTGLNSKHDQISYAPVWM